MKVNNKILKSSRPQLIFQRGGLGPPPGYVPVKVNNRVLKCCWSRILEELEPVTTKNNGRNLNWLNHPIFLLNRLYTSGITGNRNLTGWWPNQGCELDRFLTEFEFKRYLQV